MSDLALIPAAVIHHPGSEYADENRQFQGIPSVERSPADRLWAAWYSGGDWEGPGNYLLLATSGDDGETWAAPVLAVIPPEGARAFDPCLWLDPQGRLWFFWAQCLGALDGRYGVWAMVTENADEELPAWSPPRRLSDGIMMNKPTVTLTGDWLLPVSIWKGHGAHHPPIYHHPGERTGAWVLVSRDTGKTFGFSGKVSSQADRIYDEHMLVERSEGSLWMLTRIKTGIWENESNDGGKTWNHGRRSSIPHLNSRFFIRRLLSGNLLLVRHDVPDKSTPPEKALRSHLTAFISQDDGRTWLGGLLLDERVGVSYPDGTQMQDGTIHVIYDFNRTLEKEIRLATFTEADVLAEEWISAVARPGQLINQATAVGRDGPVPLAVAP